MRDVLFWAFSDFDKRKQKEQFLAEELSKYYRVLFVQRALRLLLPSKDYERFYPNYYSIKLEERYQKLKSINSNLYLYTPPIDFFPLSKLDFISRLYYRMILHELYGIFKLFSPPLKPDIVYMNHPRLISLVEMFYKPNIFVILDKCGNWESEYGISYRNKILAKWLNKRANENIKKALDRANLIISSSYTFLSEIPDYAKMKSFYLPPGISEDLSFPENYSRMFDRGKHITEKVVGAVCARYTKKIINIEYLKYVIERLKDVKFIFVGAHIEELGIEGFSNVEFTGELPHDKLSDYLIRFDVAVIPYNKILSTNQGFPTKLIEYWYFGLPVVSTNFSRELIENPDIKNNIYISNSKEEFLENVVKALNLIKDIDRYNKILDLYKWENIGKRLFELIERQIDGNQRDLK